MKKAIIITILSVILTSVYGCANNTVSRPEPNASVKEALLEQQKFGNKYFTNRDGEIILFCDNISPKQATEEYFNKGCLRSLAYYADKNVQKLVVESDKADYAAALMNDGTVMIGDKQIKSDYNIIDIALHDSTYGTLLALADDGTVLLAGTASDSEPKLIPTEKIKCTAINANYSSYTLFNNKGEYYSGGSYDPDSFVMPQEKWNNVIFVDSYTKDVRLPVDYSKDTIAAMDSDGNLYSEGALSEEIKSWGKMRCIDLCISGAAGITEDGHLKLAGGVKDEIEEKMSDLSSLYDSEWSSVKFDGSLNNILLADRNGTIYKIGYSDNDAYYYSVNEVNSEAALTKRSYCHICTDGTVIYHSPSAVYTLTLGDDNMLHMSSSSGKQ